MINDTPHLIQNMMLRIRNYRTNMLAIRNANTDIRDYASGNTFNGVNNAE